MFARKYRLPAQRLQNTHIFKTSFCTLLIAKNNKEENRYGFVVSKKIDKRAVIRNRTKRKVRASFEAMHKRLQPGHDILCMLSKSVVDISAEKLREELGSVLSRAWMHPKEK